MIKKLFLGVICSSVLSCSFDFPEIGSNFGETKFTHTGDEGKLFFSSSEPIAAGSKTWISVRNEDQEEVSVSRATSSNQSVIKVRGSEGNKVLLEAVDAGESVIDIEGDLNDSVTIRSVVANRVVFDAACWRGEPLFLFEQKSRKIGQYLYKDDEAARGFGFYPAEISEGTIDSDANTEELSFTLPDELPASKTVRISSTIDDAELVIDLVQESEIDEVEISIESVESGARSCFSFISKREGEVICRAKPRFEIEILTPDACELTNAEGLESVLLALDSAWACVLPKGDMSCEVKMNFPDANEGEGISFTHAL